MILVYIAITGPLASGLDMIEKWVLSTPQITQVRQDGSSLATLRDSIGILEESSPLGTETWDKQQVGETSPVGFLSTPDQSQVRAITKNEAPCI